jgi:alkaline phosphatase D
MTTRRHVLSALGALAAASTLKSGRVHAKTPRFASDPFTLGVASGYPTPRSVVLWTRLAPEPFSPDGGITVPVIPVQWELATDENMRSVVRSGVEYASAEWAHSVHVEPDWLEAGRDYWYRFTVGRARSPIGRTRTAAAANDANARLRLALASCQHYEQGYFSPLRHIAADNPDLVVHVGDYIYEYNTISEGIVRRHNLPEAYTLEDYRARYALYKSDPDLLAAHAVCPWLVTWDDHEVDNDYAGGISEEDDSGELFLARRAAAYRAYYEHMPLPRRAVPSGAHMRLYAQRTFGNLASIYMLDQRQYRAPEACGLTGKPAGNRGNCAELSLPTRTMLGASQEGWLEAQLRRSRTKWNLLAQGTVMSYLDEDPGAEKLFWSDSWNGYPAAREQVVSLLERTQVSNPVVLTGDIHSFLVGGLNRVADNPESPLIATELVTTSVSSWGIPQQTLDAWRSINPNVLLATSSHRGYVRLDITPERLSADLVGIESAQDPLAAARTIQKIVIESNQPRPLPG